MTETHSQPDLKYWRYDPVFDFDGRIQIGIFAAEGEPTPPARCRT